MRVEVIKSFSIINNNENEILTRWTSFISLSTPAPVQARDAGLATNSDGYVSCKLIGCMLLSDIFQLLVNGFHGVRNSCGISSN